MRFSRNWPELLLGGLTTILAFTVCTTVHWGVLDSFLELGNDSRGYYQYLPGFFIEDDMTKLFWSHPLMNGNHLALFQIGVAIMQGPFFLVAHLCAMLFNLPVTGYSMPYCLAVFAATATYTGAAVTLLALAVKREFGRPTGLFVVASLFLCSNLYFYSAYQPGMSHAYTFFLVALVVFLTPIFWQEGRGLFGIALALGLIVLVRPNNGVVLFYFLLYSTSPSNLRDKALFLLRRWKAGLPAVAIVLFSIALQMSYWHLVSGEYLLFTYATKGEGFEWTKAAMSQVLFSHQNGWFMYHPFLLLPMAGVVWCAVSRKFNGLLVLCIWALCWYIIASWWNWWFGAAFGHRAFLDILPLLAIPFGFLVKRLFLIKPMWPKALAVGICALLCFCNLRLSHIYELDLRSWDGAEWNKIEFYKVWKSVFQ